MYLKNLETNINCYICKNNKVYKFWPTIYSKNIFVNWCESCNHGFLFPYLSEDEIKKFYEKEYRKIFYNQTPLFNSAKYVKKMLQHRGQWKHSNLWAKYILNENKTAKTIIDIGSGFGPFIDNIYELNQNIKISSIEPDVKSRELGQHSKEISFFENTEEIINKNIKFDIITAFHTFEHIKDPVKFLKDLKKILNKDGKIYIETPNGEGIWKKKTFAHLAHPQIYSKRSITKLSSFSGLKVISYFIPTEEIEKGQNLGVELQDCGEETFLNKDFDEEEILLKDKFIKAEWKQLDNLLFNIKKIAVVILPLRIVGLIARTLQSLRK